MRLKAKVGLQILVSGIWLSAAHLPYVGQAIIVIPGCLAFGYAYVVWRDRGRKRGFWAAAAAHAWSNLISFGLMALLHAWI